MIRLLQPPSEEEREGTNMACVRPVAEDTHGRARESSPRIEDEPLLNSPVQLSKPRHPQRELKWGSPWMGEEVETEVAHLVSRKPGRGQGRFAPCRACLHETLIAH